MEIVGWKMSIRSKGHGAHSAAQLELEIDYTCPICERVQPNKAACELSQWEVRNFKNLHWLVEIATGGSSGQFCQKCGVLSLCLKQDQLQEQIAEQVTAEVLEHWVRKLGLKEFTAVGRDFEGEALDYTTYRGQGRKRQPIASSAEAWPATR